MEASIIKDPAKELAKGPVGGPAEDPAVVAITPGAEEDGKQSTGMYLAFQWDVASGNSSIEYKQVLGA